MRHRVSMLAIVMLAWAQAVPANAYNVQTGLTEGCHERITAKAFLAFLDSPAWAEVVVPEGETWRDLARPLNRWLLDAGLIQEDLSEPQLFVLFSLIVGVRAPDTNGHSTSDLATQRSIHANPRAEAQYLHALRAPQDDEPDGSRRAVMGTRASIRRSFSDAAAAWREPSEVQISTAPVTLDFYDLFPVEIWLPGFLLGEAVHSLQDSFAHTVRSDALDFTKIAYVLNYVDAIYKSFEESRDGIAHSGHLDRCDSDDLGALREAGDLATEELLGALIETQVGDASAVDDFLDRWVTLQEGCTFENDFCGNPSGLAAARMDPSGPILPKWMSCSARVEPDASTWASVACICLLLALAARLARHG
jgi:hypothetical protein